MKLLAKLQQSKNFWFLFITSLVFFLLRLPSLFEPYWYGDEGIYEVIGFALRHGRLLYTGIWDNKPPLLYLIYAVFNGDQMPVKLFSLVMGLVAIWAIFFLSKKLFVHKIAAFVATGVFALLFALPLLEGNIANAENFMLPLGIIAGYLVLRATQPVAKHQKHPLYQILYSRYVLFFTAGILLGFSFLLKVVGLFDLAAFAVFLFLVQLERITLNDLFKSVQHAFSLFLGFLLPIILCVGFFIAHHTFQEFLHATLFSNVGYVNYGNQFIIPQGFLILKTLLLGLIVLFFLLKRKAFSPTTLFLFLWLPFSLYSALFSQRPYTHYMLVLLPSFSLLVGYSIANKKNLLIAGGIALALLLFVSQSFTFYGKILPYYQNFFQYILGQKSTVAYQAYFDRVTPRDARIAEYINTHRQPGQTIYIWGNSGQIYKLTNTLPPGRFIVTYHVTISGQNMQETKAALEQNPPTFLIILPNQPPFPLPFLSYNKMVIIGNAYIYEHVF